MYLVLVMLVLELKVNENEKSFLENYASNCLFQGCFFVLLVLVQFSNYAMHSHFMFFF